MLAVVKGFLSAGPGGLAESVCAMPAGVGASAHRSNIPSDKAIVRWRLSRAIFRPHRSGYGRPRMSRAVVIGLSHSDPSWGPEMCRSGTGQEGSELARTKTV